MYIFVLILTNFFFSLHQTSSTYFLYHLGYSTEFRFFFFLLHCQLDRSLHLSFLLPKLEKQQNLLSSYLHRKYKEQRA